MGLPLYITFKARFSILKLINAPAVFVENFMLSLCHASVLFVKLLLKAALYTLNTLTQGVGVAVILKEEHVS